MDKARLDALKEDQAAVAEMLDSRGWRVLENLVRQVQRQATHDLKISKEPQELFQAQGVLAAFEKMWGAVDALRNADETALIAMIEEE